MPRCLSGSSREKDVPGKLGSFGSEQKRRVGDSRGEKLGKGYVTKEHAGKIQKGHLSDLDPGQAPCDGKSALVKHRGAGR